MICSHSIQKLNETGRSNEVEKIKSLLMVKFGHVYPSDVFLRSDEYTFHFRTSKDVVNQGLCYYAVKQHVYFVKSRSDNCGVAMQNSQTNKADKDWKPKEVIYIEVETPINGKKYKYVDFYVTGNTFVFKIN